VCDAVSSLSPSPFGPGWLHVLVGEGGSDAVSSRPLSLPCWAFFSRAQQGRSKQQVDTKNDDFENKDPYYKGMHSSIQDSFIGDVVDTSKIRTNDDMDYFMKCVKPYHYEFIPNVTSLLENEGECVIDQISRIYGET